MGKSRQEEWEKIMGEVGKGKGREVVGGEDVNLILTCNIVIFNSQYNIDLCCYKVQCKDLLLPTPQQSLNNLIGLKAI